MTSSRGCTGTTGGVVRKAESVVEVEVREQPGPARRLFGPLRSDDAPSGRGVPSTSFRLATGRSSRAACASGSCASTPSSPARSSRASSASSRRRGSTTTSAPRSSLHARSARAICSCSRRRAGGGNAATSSSISAEASGGREDSLWEYKHRFSPDGRREAWIGKLVHDDDAYAALGGSRDRSGFFPAYRGLSASV